MPFIDIEFGELLPDLGGDPNPNMPGYLVQAENVRPTARGWRPDNVDGTPSNTLGATPIGAFSVNNSVFAGTASELYQLTSGTWGDVSSATYTAALFWDFCAYDENVIAVNGISGDTPQSKDIVNSSAAAAFADLSGAPASSHCARIRDFLVVSPTNPSGDVLIRWPGIDDITAWHTAGTATALSTQAGEQKLERFDGSVSDIVSGENDGVVLQDNAAWRMTYVGGDIVWLFDKIGGSEGSRLDNTGIRVNDLFYYLSETGVWVTDGYKIENLSVGKIRDSIIRLIDHPEGNLNIPGAGFGVVHDTRDNSVNWQVRYGTNEMVLKYNVDFGSFSFIQPTASLYPGNMHGIVSGAAGFRAVIPRTFNDSGLVLDFDDNTQVPIEMQTGYIELSRLGKEVQVTSVHPLGSQIPSTMTASFKMVRDLSNVDISRTGFKNFTASTRSVHLHPGATSRTGKYIAFRLSGNYDADVRFRGFRVYFEETGET